jgi:transcriptional regulator with XRE-family HTH domain
MRADTGPALRLRRMELGLSQTDVSREAGLSRSAVENIERGADLGAWPLHRAIALLSALSLPLTWLEDQARAPASDISRLGAELARTGSVGPDQLTQLKPATAAELGHILAEAGMVVVKHAGTIRLAPADAPAPLERFVMQDETRFAISGANAIEDAVLTAVAEGTIDLQRLSANQRRALATLIRAGLVDDGPERPQLSPDLRAVMPECTVRREP